jgi:hypothetical protein
MPPVLQDTEGVGLSRARVVVHAVRAIARQQQAADKKRKKGDEAAIVAAKGAGVKITELEVSTSRGGAGLLVFVAHSGKVPCRPWL